MNYPSVKRIMEGLECDKVTAKAIRVSIKDRSQNKEERLNTVNKIIDGCGVEGIGECDMRNGPPLLYVNMGDTYTPTICLFKGHFRVSDWGTIVETHPSLFKD